MSDSTARDKKAATPGAKLAAVPSVPAAASTGSDEHPGNIINDRLSRACATLDLLFNAGPADGEGFDSLCTGTLATALYGAMQDIELARELFNREVAHVGIRSIADRARRIVGEASHV
jgi:hypothetical protein